MSKICIKCKLEKPELEFYKFKYGKNGLTARCKKCVISVTGDYQKKNRKKKNEINRKYRKKNIANNKLNAVDLDKPQICCKCHELKPKSEYFKSNNEPTGTTRRCKKCLSKPQRNPEKVKNASLKSRIALQDCYIKQKLRRRGFTNEIIDSNPELVKGVREILKIKRYVKEKTGKKHPGTKV